MILTPEQLAEGLIGVKARPQGLDALIGEAQEARAYDALKPYPQYAYRTWKIEDKGPLPRCMPLARRIVRRCARFLFGDGINITCPGNTKLEEYLRDAWEGNEMESRAVAMAEKGGVEGGIALKFSYDPEQTPSLRIQTLSLVDQVRLYYHPHDRRRLLMARIQYRYQDPAKGGWFWYREEWTAQHEVHYEPVEETALLASKQDADCYDSWVESERKANPFGLIPVTQVQNLDKDDLYGTGDLWGLFRLLDDLNLAWWQMKRSNQFDSELNPHYVDLQLEDEDIDKPLDPGQPVALESTSETKQGQVIFPPGGNSLRPAMMEYARELRKAVEEASGAASIDQAEVTNKGNMTQAVLTQMYAILIELCKEKRKSYGKNGIQQFLIACAKGLQANGVALGVTDDKKSYGVELAWPSFFEMSEEEKKAFLDRITAEETARYTTHERAVQAVAGMEKVPDVPELLKEIEALPPPEPLVQDPNQPKSTSQPKPATDKPPAS